MYVDEETGRMKLDAVMTIARKLMDEFTSDDTTKVSADVIDMNKKMNDTVSRWPVQTNRHRTNLDNNFEWYLT